MGERDTNPYRVYQNVSGAWDFRIPGLITLVYYVFPGLPESDKFLCSRINVGFHALGYGRDESRGHAFGGHLLSFRLAVCKIHGR